MDAYKIHRDILCIDLKSFFASVECALRGLDPFNTPLIVADKGRGGGSIVLAVTPYLKARGVPSRCRLHEIPKIKDLIIATPRMRSYVAFSEQITKIYLRYVAPEDIHIYSIDEAFLDLTAYRKYYQKPLGMIARDILDDIYDTTKIPATCGIGDTLLLSKLALDLYSKKASDGIAAMHYEDVETMLWPIQPLSKMWGIGTRMEKRLNALGMYKVGDIAQGSKKLLKKHFGVIGEELFYHAHGIDMSIISDPHGYRHTMKTVGLGQTLFKDYEGKTIPTILLEMTDEVAEKLRFVKQRARTIHLGIGYSKKVGGGFSRQMTLEQASNDPETLLEAVFSLFLKHYDDAPIRRVSIRASHLTIDEDFTQIGFFENTAQKSARKALWQNIDIIRKRYGKQSVLRLASLLESGTLKTRAALVGGHRA